MNKQKGFTLIEIMIALMLGIIVIGGALSIYISTIRSSTDITNSARLNYDLDSVMQLMINDIRRAGYWGGAISGSDAKDNPFTNSTTSNIQLLDPIVISGTTFYRCILYTYDFDEDTVLDRTGGTSDDTSEFFGFKLDDGEIKIWSKKIPDATGDCSEAGWQTIINEDKINISLLQFVNTNSQCLNITTNEVYPGSCSAAIAAAVGTVGKISSDDMAVETRQIDITLTGNVLNDTPVTKTLTGIVKVRNDRIFTQP